MALTRWDPFREMVSLQDRMSRLLDMAGSGSISRSGDDSLLSSAFIPPVDVYEDEHSVILKMEVPGVEQKDIDVQLENNVLSIQGERKFDKDEKKENFQRIERYYGSFNRSFTLPNTVDPNSVQADYENGILKVTLAKRAEAKPKQIKVNVGSKQISDVKKSA
jgi:HSP20 family protein